MYDIHILSLCTVIIKTQTNSTSKTTHYLLGLVLYNWFSRVREPCCLITLADQWILNGRPETRTWQLKQDKQLQQETQWHKK